jgi:uncharacterized protein (DUF2062 family)
MAYSTQPTFKKKERSHWHVRHRWVRRRAWKNVQPHAWEGAAKRIPFGDRFLTWTRQHPHLFQFRPSTIIPALYIGAILTALPLPIVDIPLAILLAVLFRANLGIILLLLFIINPVTAAPVLVLAYYIGSLLINHMQAEQLQHVVRLLVGGVVAGAATGFIMHVGYRIMRTLKHLRDKKRGA